jgi:hypothetical protein
MEITSNRSCSQTLRCKLPRLSLRCHKAAIRDADMSSPRFILCDESREHDPCPFLSVCYCSKDVMHIVIYVGLFPALGADLRSATRSRSASGSAVVEYELYLHV